MNHIMAESDVLTMLDNIAGGLGWLLFLSLWQTVGTDWYIIRALDLVCDTVNAGGLLSGEKRDWKKTDM